MIYFGLGDEADSERLRLMVAANTSRKPSKPREQKRIAMYLYHDENWSIARIADALD